MCWLVSVNPISSFFCQAVDNLLSALLYSSLNMDYDFHSELEALENIISRLESTLANVDSEHEREKEALERSYERRKESLQNRLAPLKAARAAFLENEQPESDPGERPERTGPMSPDGAEPYALPDEGDSVGLNGNAESRLSIRREIENLLPEMNPSRDVVQGEVTRRLQDRFPQHKDSITAASVSSSLRRLENAGVLVLSSKGSGSEPNRYRLPGSEERNESQEELRE